jgi:hypothetical protein
LSRGLEEKKNTTSFIFSHKKNINLNEMNSDA